ncbi:hypothetical protein NK8_83220 (plasmid) [Caballeronia sp. NK8]|nr:hypothetical protein NK8_83220 [Caballeronia sp. NK8]
MPMLVPWQAKLASKVIASNLGIHIHSARHGVFKLGAMLNQITPELCISITSLMLVRRRKRVWRSAGRFTVHSGVRSSAIQT